jgi:hypothetical protein
MPPDARTTAARRAAKDSLKSALKRPRMQPPWMAASLRAQGLAPSSRRTRRSPHQHPAEDGARRGGESRNSLAVADTDTDAGTDADAGTDTGAGTDAGTLPH